MRRYTSILIVLIAFAVSAGFAQRSANYSITNYNIGNGLATNKIHHAAQDSLHRMWFATGYGISIYDGFKWENIHLIDNQNNAGFKKIIFDRRGNTWLLPVVSNHHIKIDKGKGWEDLLIAPGSPVEPELINDGDLLYSKGKPVLLIVTAKNLYIMISNKWIRLPVKEETYRCVEAFGDSFFLAGEEGLSVLKIGDNGKPVITKGLAGINTPILAIRHIVKKSSSPAILVLGHGWAGEIAGGKLVKFDVDMMVDETPSMNFYYIIEDLQGTVYFGNKLLKYSYDRESGSLSPLSKLKGFTSEGATSTFVDTEGNIWFCDLRGIDKMTFHPFKNYYRMDGLLEDEVTAAIEFEPGKFIFGHNSGYTLFSREGTKTFSFRDQSSLTVEASRVLDLAMDDKGTIWAACGNFGLVRIDPNSGFTRVAQAPTPVSSIMWDKRYGLLVATTGNLYILKGNSLEYVSPAWKPVNLRKLFRFNDRIFAASAEGVFSLEGKQLRNLIPDEDQMTANVFAMLALNKDSIFIGAESGLHLLLNGRLLKFSKNDFSISKSIYFIIRSKDGNIWFGTADGLIRWDGGSNVHEYIVQDGLSGYEMNRSAAIIDSRNTLWIGTNSGLSSYRLQNSPHDVPPPKVWLASIETSSGERLSLDKENIIAHNNNTLSFSIRGISFISENLIKYKVKLEGFDEDFYEITQSQLQNIRYLNLPSGSYRLVVMAKNRFSEWSRPVFSKVILIEKPLYLQTWFILLILTVIVTAVLFGNKYFLTTREHTRLEEMVEQRTKDLAKSQKELKATLDGLEEQVRQRTEELENSNRTKDKIFSIISHDLRSPFMSILGYSELLHEDISSIDPATVEKYTGRIIEASQNTLTMIDGLLDWSKLQMGGIVPTNENIHLRPVILEIEDLFKPQVAAKKLSLITEVDPQIHITSDPAILRTVIRNLLSNAIKFTNNGGLIKISATQYDEMVSIQISDTGIGIPEDIIPTLFTFDTVQSRKGTANEKGTGLGLSLVHDLLEKVGGQITLQSTVGTGTVFSVTLPVERA